MKLIIIAALARNRVIGKNGKLPWRIPEDIQRFKQLTTGHTVLMGRRTFESIGAPLPHRRNVVITSHDLINVETYPSLQTALMALEKEEKVYVIGGGQVFHETFPFADELYLTILHQRIDGDTFFPPYEDFLQKNFHLVHEERHEGFAFLDYARRK